MAQSRYFIGAYCITMLYQFPRAVVAKHCKLGALRQQGFVLSQFWWLEDLFQGVGRALLSPKAPGGESIP